MKSTERYDYDVVVIGGGSAGYAAARTCAAGGLRTAVVEGGDEVGGLCILRGCMPTKALLYASEVMHLARNPTPWGIRTKEVTFDFEAVMARKDRLIREFADCRVDQLKGGKFDFIRAMATFTDAHTLALTPVGKAPGKGSSAGGANRVSAGHFIIATGSSVAPPPLPALSAVDYLTSDTALKLVSLPRSMIVLGGGAVALEFAQFFARFGVEITLVQRSPHVLHEMDPDAAEVIESVFRREGMTVFTGTKLLDAKRSGRLKEITFEHDGTVHRASAEEVFFGLGRVPKVHGLGLESVGINIETGRIEADGHMRTSVPHIYAAGDCAGPYEIVHIAIQQAETAAFNIAEPDRPREMDYRLLTEVVFTDPQIASVGLTEKRAHAGNVAYKAASYPFDDHGKSMIMDATDGFVKLLGDPVSGEILGGSCVGPVGGELIHEIIAAMSHRMTVRELAALPHYHPTLAEIWTYPAEELAEKLPPRAGS